MKSKIFERYNIPCTECGTIENLTRHHLKNLDGKKTGTIKILCRSCHDKAEDDYAQLGIRTDRTKLTDNEKLHLKYINGKIPFYSSK